MTISVDTRMKAAIIHDKYYLLNKHLLDCYYKMVPKENIQGLIKQHKRLISQLDLHYKKTPKTLSILENYANHKDKILGFSTVTNTINKRGLFLSNLYMECIIWIPYIYSIF